MISVTDCTKTFAGHIVVDNVSLKVGSGEVVAIVGPSGAGKSTLLRCINLLEIPDCGVIRVGAHTIDTSKPYSQRDLRDLRRTAGMVFQSFNLFPHLTAIQNICLAQETVLKTPRRQARERALALLDQVGLREKADSYPTRLSGGQQQRIAIARALALEPEVVLFDEPTSALDPELGLDVLQVMRDLAQGGMTMIVVTHEIAFARDVSDRIIVMADGAILEMGAPRDILSQPTTARAKRFLQSIVDRS